MPVEQGPARKMLPRYLPRLIFNHLEEALSSQPQGTATEEDASLPPLDLNLLFFEAQVVVCSCPAGIAMLAICKARNPLRFGKLCGKSSCYEL